MGSDLNRVDIARLLAEPEAMQRVFNAAAKAATEEQIKLIREAEELERIREADADERSWVEG